jgi:hypothetical protein
MAAQRRPGRALRYAEGSARGLLVHHDTGTLPKRSGWSGAFARTVIDQMR